MLFRSLELAPGNVDIQLEMAAGYSLEAQPVTLQATRSPTAAQYLATLALLREAGLVISAIGLSGDDDLAAVQQAHGLNLAEISRVGYLLSRLLEREAESLSRVPEASAEKRAEAGRWAEESAVAAKQAMALLMDVLRRDNQRATAAGTLVELCLDNHDAAALEQARNLIMNQERPPALAAAMLLRDDLRQAFSESDVKARGRRITEIASRLDEVIEQYGDHVRIRLTRAEAAMLQHDWAKAAEMIEKVLEGDAGQREARLMWGQVLLHRQDYVEAEKVLRSLSTEARQYAPAHYFYGLAARGSGFGELAMSAMRTAVEVQPNYLEPRIFMADRLLENNRPELAFLEAEQAYRLNPTDSGAVQIYVRAAVANGRAEAAREALQRFRDEAASGPEALRALAYGYGLLGDNKGKVEALEALSAREPSSLNGQMARALALHLDNRSSEAIAVLQDACREYPGEPEPRSYLARIYVGERRVMQAAETLRELLGIAGDDIESRLLLAQLYFQNGMLNECRQIGRAHV